MLKAQAAYCKLKFRGKFMSRFNLFSFYISVLISILLPLTAFADARFINNGKPVQVRKSSPVADVNHRDDFSQYLVSKPQVVKTDPPKQQAVDGPPLLKFPLRRGFSNTNPGFYGISNYVDLDEVHPDMLLDYACGERTYDTDDFDHNGIDIASSMFSWWTMANDGLVVIAAADGTIVQRHDGEPDQQCAFSDSADSNLIVLEHDDGSVTIYAHMKKETVTGRKVGDRVEAGDYLGVVGSSGLSTGPHLHLGVHDKNGDLIEPYAGECNNLNLNSWWADQEDYYVKTINAVRTHSALPEYPACPGIEVPHFNDEFKAGDTVFLSATVRDFLKEDVLEVEIRDPSGEVAIETTYSQDETEHFGAVSVVFGVDMSANTESGAYVFAVTYAEKTVEYTFYIDSGPDPRPAAVEANNAYNGLFYDPALDGEGYNIVTADSGTIIYFYGSDSGGNRVWLISDLIPGLVSGDQPLMVNMYESTGGVFGSPVTSARGLSSWGTLKIDFTDCNNGLATLTGVDGDKVSRITKIAGVAGTNCTSGDVPPDAAWSGLWFDSSLDGEGYNLVVAPPGRVLYYYGFKSNGLRLWLISDLIVEELEVGKDVVIEMFEATQGIFSTPVPSDEALVKWGTATITLVDCRHITIVITGSDGSKTSNTVRLAGIIGLECS
jgi:murein DD-endopeptidase MepM/ murein hydrolase activator NlpD